MESTIKFKKRSAKANLRKRVPTPTSSSDSHSTSSEDDTKPRGRHTKRLKINSSTQGSKPTSSQDLFPNLFTADRAIPTNDAAITLPRAVGPVKRPTNVRTTVTTDFSPDVCKDYKQTGFCGFGDNCKFLHSREDYKQGWQLDREWEDVTQGKKKVYGTVFSSRDGEKAKEDEDSDEEALLDSIPFACIICKESYKEPIVTRCGHYFCEPCALKRYRKDPACAVCGAGTNGVFNSAKRLEKLLELKRERSARRRLAGTEARDEISDENEGQP